MGDRTEELRELFESVTGTETVTERQRRPRGSLRSESDERAALEAEVEAMRSARSFETALPSTALATIVEHFYAGASDAEIATRLDATEDDVDADAATVAAARLDLHLVRESDRPDPEAASALEAVPEEKTVAEAATDLDVPTSTVEQWLRVKEIQTERRQVADRYRQAFETILQNRDIAERLTASLEETGLEGAVADQEVDVDM